MHKVSAGDMAAFERLVERHEMLVVGTVARMLGGNADVDDVAQQVFVRVWKSARRYRPAAKFTTWLLTITRNLVFNELRRKRRHVEVPLEFRHESAEIATPVENLTQNPATALLHDELARAIDAAIRELPETQRMALVLRRYEGLSYEEIADVLDQTVSGVKSLLFRARTDLRERLRGYLET